MCVLIEIDWIRTNEYSIIFPSQSRSSPNHFVVKSPWLLFFAFFFVFPSCRVCSLSFHFVIFLTKNALYTHTHASINQSKMPRPTNDKITLISAQPEQERFEVSTDVAKCVLLYVITVFFNFFAFERKTREIALLGIAVSPSLPLDSTVNLRSASLIALNRSNAPLTRRTDRFSPFFYVQTACRRPWKPPSVVRISNASFVSFFSVSSSLFFSVFFEKVMSNWRENFLHITQQEKKPIHKTE